MVLKTGQEIWHCGLKIRCYQLTKLLHYKMSSGGWLKWRKVKTHLEAAAPLSKKTLLSSSSLCLGARLAPCAIVRLSLLLSSSSPIPSPFPFLLLLSPFYGFITALRGFFCRPLWVSLRPLWRFTSPLGGSRLLDGKGFLMWLRLSLWHMVWRLLPTWALPLEKFRFESLIFYPPWLRLDLFNT